jgi:hypothetical protein
MENAAMNRFANIETQKIDRQTINAPQYGINRKRKRQKRLQMEIRHQRRMRLLAGKTTSASGATELS